MLINALKRFRLTSSNNYWQRCKYSNIIRSKLSSVQIPSVTLNDFVWKGLNVWQDKTAVVCAETGRNYKYHELHDKTKALAYFLKTKLDLSYGDTVAVVLPNVPEYPIIILAAIQAGLKVTTVNPIYTKDEIAKQIQNSETKLVFTLNELWDKVDEAVKSVPNANITIATINHKSEISSPHSAIKFEEMCQEFGENDFDNPNLDDVVLLPYSSGTTGNPKGVEHTQKSIVANLHQISHPDLKPQIDSDGSFQDVSPAILPLFHIYGLMVGTLNMLASGCKLVTVPKFGSDVLLKILKEHKPSVLGAVPPMIMLITNHQAFNCENLQTLRVIISGAAPLGATDIERFHKKTKNKIQLAQGYGLTEAPVTHMQPRHVEGGIKFGSSGFCLPHTECKFVAVDGDTKNDLGPNETGELLIRGPQVLKGFYKNPTATKEAIDVKGWFRTGDIGHYDEDGHFYITDRLKELIKVKGFQVAPAELEAILRDHPLVEDAAVVGIPHAQHGEIPRAFVVSKEAKEDQLKEYVAAKVAPYKQLAGGVIFVDAIPKTPSGKILRRQLRQL